MLEKLESILSSWEETLPEDMHNYIRNKASDFTQEEIADFLEKFENTGRDWGFSPISPLAQELLNDVVRMVSNTDLRGGENLESALKALADSKVERLCIVSNHLSYADANLIATYFHPYFQKYGFGDKLSVVVGPKVFNDKFKKLSSMHFNTLLIAQSLSIATKEASLSPREIAKAALTVVRDIKKIVKMLLIFPEGARSRTGGVMRFIPGVLRLIDVSDDTAVLPVSVIGGDKILPINEKRLYHSDVTITIGQHQRLGDIKREYAASEHSKQDVMDHLGRLVAELHPEDRRGYYS